MIYDETTPFYRLLATKYDPQREPEALDILEQHPEIALLHWPGPDDRGQPFVRGSTALHYAANDGKLELMARLVEHGADVNADGANWWRSVLAWAANNARLDALRWLLDHGARPDALDALHAAACGGSTNGQDPEKNYTQAIKLLVDAGADINDRRHYENRTPLFVALDTGHEQAAACFRELGGTA